MSANKRRPSRVPILEETARCVNQEDSEPVQTALTHTDELVRSEVLKQAERLNQNPLGRMLPQHKIAALRNWKVPRAGHAFWNRVKPVLDVLQHELSKNAVSWDGDSKAIANELSGARQSTESLKVATLNNQKLEITVGHLLDGALWHGRFPGNLEQICANCIVALAHKAHLRDAAACERSERQQQREAPSHAGSPPGSSGPLADEPPSCEHPTCTQVVGEHRPYERPAGEQPAGDQPAGEQPANDHPADDESADEHLAGEHRKDQPSTEEPLTAQKPIGERSIDERSIDGQPADESPTDEPPTDRQPEDQQQIHELPEDELPIDEQPPDEQLTGDKRQAQPGIPSDHPGRSMEQLPPEVGDAPDDGPGMINGAIDVHLQELRGIFITCDRFGDEQSYMPEQMLKDPLQDGSTIRAEHLDFAEFKRLIADYPLYFNEERESIGWGNVATCEKEAEWQTAVATMASNTQHQAQFVVVPKDGPWADEQAETVQLPENWDSLVADLIGDVPWQEGWDSLVNDQTHDRPLQEDPNLLVDEPTGDLPLQEDFDLTEDQYTQVFNRVLRNGPVFNQPYDASENALIENDESLTSINFNQANHQYFNNVLPNDPVIGRPHDASGNTLGEDDGSSILADSNQTDTQCPNGVLTNGPVYHQPDDARENGFVEYDEFPVLFDFDQTIALAFNSAQPNGPVSNQQHDATENGYVEDDDFLALFNFDQAANDHDEQHD